MNKKIISILLVLSMLVGMLAMMPIQIGAAEVTAENADIVIKNEQDWYDKLSNETIGSKTVFVDAKELDFDGWTIKPIKGFCGKFNGNGVVIKNLHMGADVAVGEENGIFSCPAGDVTIENFVITDSSFSGTKWVGAVLCCTSAATTVRNVFVSGSVEVYASSENAGGIIGAPGSNGTITTIEDCVVAATVKTGSKYSGGIIGRIHRAKNDVRINNCLVTGKTRNKGASSGFVGQFEAGSLTMTNCIYAGGAENDFFASYPLVRNQNDSKSATYDVTLDNCYTTHVCSDNTVIAGKTYEAAGVTYLNKSRDSLIGLDCATTVEGFTKRDGDIMIPNGVAGFKSTGIFAKFTVTWKNYDGTVLSSEKVQFGKTPEYNGEAPTRAEDAQFTYTFADKWSPAVTAVSADVTYTALFDRQFKSNNVSDDYYDVWYGESNYSYTTFGSGTKEDPYVIRSAAQWANLAEASASGISAGLYFELAVNLDFNNIEGLKPISPDTKRTLIYFDGKGHTIKGVNMSGTKDGVALFGDIWGCIKEGAESSSVIKNFVITESVFNGGNYAGALVGETSGTVLIQNIYVDSSVVVNSSKGKSGGIVGGCYYDSQDFDDNGVAEYTVTIEDCVFAGKVYAKESFNGGILGYAKSTDNEIFHVVINNSLVTGFVENKKSSSSGFVGSNAYTQDIKDGETVVKTYEASITLNGCVYAGGAEDVYFYARPFSGSDPDVTAYTVNNCYTTHTAANGVYGNTKWTKNGSGVKLVDIETLIGNAAVVPEGWVKRAGDLAIPAGVADIALPTFTNKLYDGASVRFYNPSGIRFKAIIGDDFLASFGADATFGIIIAPTDYVAEAGGVFTVKALDALSHSTNYVIVEAEKYVDGDGYIVYSAVLGDIKTTNYNRAFSAIAYVEVDGEIVYYSDYHEKTNSRSISEVAKAAYNDTKASMDATYKYEIYKDSGIYSPYSVKSRNSLLDFFGKEATDINFMSYNIRNVEGGDSNWNDPLTFEYTDREKAVLNYILSEMPDVIGIQEASVKTHTNGRSTLSWFDVLGDESNAVGLTANGYACWKGEDVLDTYVGSGGDKKMYNPIYYKADKYNLIDYGYHYLGEFDFGDDTDYKGLTWVLLEDKDTGVQFVYLNVHMPRKSSGYHEQDLAAKALMNYVEENLKGYGCPIIIGGDFNGSYSVYGEYKITENDEAYWGTTAVKGNTATNTTLGDSAVKDDFATMSGSTGAIDLYYVVNAENVVLHNYAVTDNKVESTGKYPSDHLPIKFVVTIFADKAN